MTELKTGDIIKTTEDFFGSIAKKGSLAEITFRKNLCYEDIPTVSYTVEFTPSIKREIRAIYGFANTSIEVPNGEIKPFKKASLKESIKFRLENL